MPQFSNRLVNKIKAAEDAAARLRRQAQVQARMRGYGPDGQRQPSMSEEDALKAVLAEEYLQSSARRSATQTRDQNRLDEQQRTRELSEFAEELMGQNNDLSERLAAEQRLNLERQTAPQATEGMGMTTRRAGELLAAVLAGAGALELIDPDPSQDPANERQASGRLN